LGQGRTEGLRKGKVLGQKCGQVKFKKKVPKKVDEIHTGFSNNQPHFKKKRGKGRFIS